MKIVKEMGFLRIALVWCLGLSTQVWAQSKIIGTITDEGGQPVPSATVLIAGMQKGVVSDANGTYALNNLNQGKYTLIASFVGLSTVKKTVDLGKNQSLTVDFQLLDNQVQLDGVVISSSRSGRTQQETAASITQLSAEAIQKYAANSQADILRSVPGIHAEGGGGEVASNIFVRGLPAGGQYKYTPILIDGMPVEGTFGLTSSAQDVYFRNDLGFDGLEFVRGGSATLFGVGSVAGLINYTSKVGGAVQKTEAQAEFADMKRVKLDFNTGGALSNDGQYFYNLTGSFRYDEGPIYTGLPTEGYQLRANVQRRSEKGTMTLYTQVIDDRAQFYLPFPLLGGTRERPQGHDGNTIMTLQTANAADLSYRTPSGFYTTPIRDGVVTKGGYVMLDARYQLGNDWNFNGKYRAARYNHQFHFFLDGSGVTGAPPVETQAEYVARRAGKTISAYKFTYADNGQTLGTNVKLFENRIVDRFRPFFDMTSEMSLTKQLQQGASKHNITIGTFLVRTEAKDFNNTTRYLAEFNAKPRLVNLQYTDGANNINYTASGLSGRGIGYTNRLLGSSKAAIYLSDEMSMDRLRVDVGFRYERHTGDVAEEASSVYTMDTNAAQLANLNTVRWGNGTFNRRRINASDWGGALGASYEVNNALNVYGNVSKGYFFPELRANVNFTRDSGGSFIQPDPGTEKLYQGEVGAKYGTSKMGITVALFYAMMRDRLQTDFIDTKDGLKSVTRAIGQTSSKGTEITWVLGLTKGLAFDGSFTYQKHQVDDEEIFNSAGVVTGNNKGKWIVRQPQLIANAGLNFNANAFDANISMNYEGKRYANNTNTIELDPATIINGNLGYTFNLKGKDTVRLGISAYNLMNDASITEGSPRAGDNQVEAEYFVGRPILPRRIFFRTALNL